MAFSFEEKLGVVDAEIKKRRNKWFLNAITYMDFDDVSQIIRTHISKKWGQWDQSLPLEPWINRIISNQLKNLIRNHYGSFAKPCINCPFNNSAEDNLCDLTPSGRQCNECPLFAKWSKSKKDAHNIKLAKSFDAHDFEIRASEPTPDLEKAAGRVHSLMKKRVNPKQYKAYVLMFVDALPDEQVAKMLGYKTTETGRIAGYRQLKNLRKLFVEKAKLILEEEEVFHA